MKVAVIGAGAAGLFCAGRLASEDIGVEIFERNEKPGKKIYITGKGRCNLTNNCSVNDYLSHVVTNPKFMYSAAYSFTPSDTVTYFSEELGLKLKTERGGRVFPVSDKASDVTKVLVRKAESEGASIRYGSRVTAVKTENGRVCGVFEGEKFFLPTPSWSQREVLLIPLRAVRATDTDSLLRRGSGWSRPKPLSSDLRRKTSRDCRAYR